MPFNDEQTLTAQKTPDVTVQLQTTLYLHSIGLICLNYMVHAGCQFDLKSLICLFLIYLCLTPTNSKTTKLGRSWYSNTTAV